MSTGYYQTKKLKLQKKDRERHENLSEEEKKQKARKFSLR